MKSQTNRRSKKNKTPIVKSNIYPMRINKYLAHRGVATRTGVDELIKSNKITINGKVAKLGDKVLESDKVEVRGVHTKKYLYFAYNKPKGVVSTNPQGNEKDIMQNLKLSQKGAFGKAKFEEFFPVGRIDKESHGLMIVTNDGRITDRLLNPIYNHEKEYVVKIDRPFTPGFVRNMQNGVNLTDGVTKPTIIKKIKEDIFSITLTEGRNRQIKRMTEKLGYTVRDLQRIRIQNINLNKLPENSIREIVGEEKKEFLKEIGLE